MFKMLKKCTKSVAAAAAALRTALSCQAQKAHALTVTQQLHCFFGDKLNSGWVERKKTALKMTQQLIYRKTTKNLGKNIKTNPIKWTMNPTIWKNITQHCFSVYRFQKVFLSMALHDVMKGGTPCMGTCPGRAHYWPAREQKCAHHCASFGSAAWDQTSVFLVMKKIYPCSASQRTQRYVSSGCSLFFWGSNRVLQVCLLTNILQTRPSSTLDLHIIWYWNGPSDNRSLPSIGTANGKWNGIKCLCFVDNRCSSARHTLTPPTACLQELGCFQRES